MTAAGFPHSDILGSRFVCQLPEAYRRLQRPSSAPSAKASTLCPYKLDHKDLQRCSRPLCSSQATTDPPHPAPPTPTTSSRQHQERYEDPRRPEGHPQPADTPHTREHHHQGTPRDNNQPAVPSGPNSVPSPPTSKPAPFPPTDHKDRRRTRSHLTTRRAIVDVPPSSTTPRTLGGGMGLDTHVRPTTGHTRCQMLLRKEVIQPHLPVRLPCYDLVPIASPTFDGSPTRLGHRLRVLPTFVT